MYYLVKWEDFQDELFYTHLHYIQPTMFGIFGDSGISAGI